MNGQQERRNGKMPKIKLIQTEEDREQAQVNEVKKAIRCKCIQSGISMSDLAVKLGWQYPTLIYRINNGLTLWQFVQIANKIHMTDADRIECVGRKT